MAKKNRTYYIKTYGCQMNEADSEKIALYYHNRDFLPAESVKEADEVVINTCSVRQSAEDRVYGLVNNLTKLKIENCKLKIILTGCMLRYPLRWLEEKMPQVDEFRKIDNFVSDPQVNSLSKDNAGLKVRDLKTHAWVTIMEGCDNFCTYCVVPYSRGREKSRPFAEIVCEVEELVKWGCKEITLLGQNVNSYGKDIINSKFKIQNSKLQFKSQNLRKEYNTPFALLLAILNEIDGLKKIKFLTSNPWDLTDDIIEAMKLPKIDRYLHLPVQSGDDEILHRMNRKHTVKEYLRLIKKIRQKIPKIEIGTDIIVGFPGETKKQFQNTVDLCKKADFGIAYISIYSPRLQTVAYKLKDDVPHSEKKKRWEILEELINQSH